MIQFNLLPDVKIQYIKTRRRKRLIIFISIVSSAVALGLFLLMFLFVRVNQTLHIKNLDEDINTNVSKIQETQDLDKILTIQNQLNTLPELHDQKMFSSRVTDYLNQLTPSQATISDVNVDFVNTTMTIKGNADTLNTVNKFADTLKFTEFAVKGDSVLGDQKDGQAFKDVVLKSFDVELSDNKRTRVIVYEITFSFDPTIFALVKNIDSSVAGGNPIELKVPQIISTRSETEKPTELFAPQPQSENQEGRGGN